jgi:hypothetical protein
MTVSWILKYDVATIVFKAQVDLEPLRNLLAVLLVLIMCEIVKADLEWPFILGG